MFSGLSAFPLTPMNEVRIDETAYDRLIQRLASAGVDSIGALGSTGNYAYLSRQERARVARLAVSHAGDVPVIVGIGALRSKDVLLLAEDAQQAGAAAVLLAPVSYQPLTEDEVYRLYETVSNAISVPLCVYDNPRTTQFAFSDRLLGRIAQLPNVASMKIPGVSTDLAETQVRVERLRALVPPEVSIGVSVDAFAAAGLSAGCDLWYSVIGGLFPNAALQITRAAQSGDHDRARQLSSKLDPLWQLFARHNGSLRCMAAAAELMGLVDQPCLPLPLQSMQGDERETLATLIQQLELT